MEKTFKAALMLAAITLISAVSFGINTLKADSLPAVKSTGTDSTVVFTVTEMGCKTDSKMVETALYRKAGIKKVKIEGSTVTVTYNPSKITQSEIISVIENTGTCEDPKAKVHKVSIKFG